METKSYGFHFEEQGLSGEEGPIDPSQQYFEGSHADHAVVRETGQNTLDNPAKDRRGPIRMVFELKTMKTAEIPDIENLRAHFDAAAEQTEGQQGHDRMVSAAELAREETLAVLRISDYNTTGLGGSESVESPKSPLSRLTRGKGGSSDDERGGSFGIGSAVGPMASDLCTVFYTSVPEDTKDSVIAGYSRLATHTLNDTSYRAEGYFTNKEIIDDFNYQRPAPKVGPFDERTESGTDIFLLGYRMAEVDPELERVRDAVIDNFMAAIDAGHLVVEGIAPGNHWKLDTTTLKGFVEGRPDAKAFYEALKDSTPAETELEHLGRVRLCINIDDRLEKKLHTITMRTPLMKIDTFKHNSISAKYAAVLICDSTEGNKLLRKLEPPQHHLWDPGRDQLYGRKVINALKKFVRDSLRERISEEIGDEITIDGLSRFLPTTGMEMEIGGDPSVPTSDTNAETDDAKESSTVTGKPGNKKPTPTPPGKKIRVKARRQATSRGEKETEQGKNRDGKRRRKTKKTGLPGTGEPGDGASRIRGHDLTFRSWVTQDEGKEHSVIALAITTSNHESGDLELIGLGQRGVPEKGFQLRIARAVHHLSSGTRDIKVSGNTLKNLSFSAGQNSRIDIYVPAGERYRLGVL